VFSTAFLLYTIITTVAIESQLITLIKGAYELNSLAEKMEMIYTAASNIMLITLRETVADLIKRPYLTLIQVT